MDLPHLRNFRQRAILSQNQLAEKSGVARDTISKLENGQRRAYPSTIHKLATGLEVAPQMLLGGVQYIETETDEEPGKEQKSDRKIGFQQDK